MELHPDLYFYFLFIFFILLTGLSFKSCRVSEDGKNEFWELNPISSLVFFFFLYSMAKPISIIFFGSEFTPLTNNFLEITILAQLGILFALLLIRTRAKGRIPPTVLLWRKQPGLAISWGGLLIASSALFLIGLYSRVAMLGFDLSNLLSVYGTEASITGDYDTFDTLAGHLMIGSAIFTSIVCMMAYGPKSRRARCFIYLLIATAIFFVMRGSRNYGLMAMLPLLAIKYGGQRLKPFKVIAITVIAFFAMQLIAIARNIGWTSIEEITKIEISALAPEENELGCPYNVFRIYSLVSHYYERRWGTTYTFDNIINLIPKAIWPTRPYSISEDFSRVYLGTSEITEGYGFSPVLEALVNFGGYGVMPVFFLTVIIIYSFSNWLLKKITPLRIVCWATICPFMVNWNRIDASTVTKMYLTFVLFYLVINFFSAVRTRQAQKVKVL